MAKKLHERLREKGWSEEEISKTVSIMGGSKHDAMQRKMSVNFYWMFLIILTVINFFVSISLIPLLLVLPMGILAIILVIIGLGFGMLFNLLIWDIEYIDVKHHVGSTLFLPALAIVSITLIVYAANKMAENIEGGIQHSPAVVAAIYVFAFLAPYLISVVKKNFWKV